MFAFTSAMTPDHQRMLENATGMRILMSNADNWYRMPGRTKLGDTVDLAFYKLDGPGPRWGLWATSHTRTARDEQEAEACRARIRVVLAMIASSWEETEFSPAT